MKTALPRWLFQVRDDASIATARMLLLWLLVGAPLSAQPDPATWQVSERPLLRIGAAGGPEEYLFQNVTGIVPLPDGRLAVADNGFLSIRVYDADGQYLHEMGERGPGPGEFYSIRGIWLTSDGELAAWDPTARRITRFDQAGNHVETRRILADDIVGNLQLFFGPLAGNEILLASLTSGPVGQGGQAHDIYLLHRYHLSGQFRASVGHAEGMYRYDDSPVPFTPIPWLVTWNDTIYIAAGYDAAIEVRDRHGSLVRTMDVPGQRAAERSEWADVEAALREREDLPAGAYQANLLEQGAIPFDERMPAIGGLLVEGDTGLIWARRFEPPRDSRWLRREVRPPAPGGRWYVLHPTLGVVARVDLPRTVVPLRIVADNIIGKDVDEFGVERVVIYQVHRGQQH